MSTMAKQTKVTPTRIRSPKVQLTKPFLDDLHARWHEVKGGTHEVNFGEKISLEEWGKRLAKGVRRPRPFDKGQVSRFLDGSHTSKEVLEAICAYFRIPSPLISPQSIAEVEWFAAGQTLAALNQEEFQKMLRLMKAKVVTESEVSELGRDTGSNPDS